MGRQIAPLHQYQARKRGVIARRQRKAEDLTDAQESLAEQIQDRYQLADFETVCKYLDWYFALMKSWITAEQFRQETGMEAPRE